MNDVPKQDVMIFAEALDLPLSERAAYLDRACAGDQELRQRVEGLLLTHDQAGGFLERPPVEMAIGSRLGASPGEKPGDRIGRYKLVQQIGEGGYGVVFVAEQEEPIRRRVALKVVKPGMDTKSVIVRFEAERQALALMDHPNISHVFDAGATESGRPYFVMELVDGVKITDYCDRHCLPINARLNLFAQVCDAIQHAHQKGIIHRDIKPSNILVTTGLGGKATPKVIDFGIAKATAGQQLTHKTTLTAREMLIGTPAYMSPEQAELSGVDVDTRTDIYSLGVLLYELLTGSTPFDGGALMKAGLDEVRRTIREKDPGRPSTRLSTMNVADLTKAAQRRDSAPLNLIRSVRGDLDWIVMKALEKDRSRRYETANGLALDVQRHLDCEAIVARPPSTVYKFQKTAQRNKLLFAGIGVIAFLLVVSLIVVSASLGKEQRARHDADAALKQAKLDKAEAEKESAKSQQVTQFLEEMLKSVTPLAAQGQDTTMLLGILDRTAERVAIEMRNQPAVEAELLRLIGRVYWERGSYDRAEKMHLAELALYRKLSGPETENAAGALNDLGNAYWKQRKLAQAEDAYNEALAIRRRLFGNDHAGVAEALNNLGGVYRWQHKLAESEALTREGLTIQRKLFGSDHLDVADSLHNLCIILGDRGKPSEAEEAAREMLAMRRRLLGNDEHPLVVSALKDLAWATGNAGKLVESESLQKEAFGIQQKILDENHPDLANSISSLGEHMRRRGNLSEAHAVLKAALSIQRKLLGEDHPDTLFTLSSLGLTYKGETNWSEAESMFREELASRRKRSGNDDQKTLYAMRNLAGALKGQGKWAETETLHREALVSWRKRSGNNDPQTLWECGELYHALVAQRKYQEAEQLLGEILTPAFLKEPACSDVLKRRLDLMGRQGRWKEAAADAVTLMQLQPTDHYWSYHVAALLVKTHNRPDYEQLCHRIPAAFAETKNPYIAARIADGCLLLADSGADLPSVDKLATKAVTLGTADGGMGHFQAIKSLSEYRAGRFPEAVEWAEKALKSPEVFARAKGCAVLAMAQWQLGLKDAARATLKQGNILAPAISSAHADTVDLGGGWLSWLVSRIPLDEATALVTEGSTPAKN